MEHHEMAEKLIEKCGITYEEAGEVLKEANYDLLEAMIILERRGKLGGGQKAKYSTNASGFVDSYRGNSEKNAFDAENIKEFLSIAWQKICEIFANILKYNVIILRRGRAILCIPMLLAIIMVLVFNYLLIPAVIIGLVMELSITVRKTE